MDDKHVVPQGIKASRLAQDANQEPTSEQVYVFSSSQLQDLVTQAIQKAVVPIQTEMDALRYEVNLERALDRKRISNLEQKEAQPMQKDRGLQLVALLALHDGMLSAKEVRQIMHISGQTLSNLLDVLPQIESRPMKTDKRRRVLVLN